MSIFKTFFKVTNTVLDLTSFGTYSYILGRKFTDTSYGKSFLESNIGAQIKSSTGHGCTAFEKFAPQVFAYIQGGKDDYKPNWGNFNNKIDSCNDMLAVAGGGMACLYLSKSIFGQTLHFPLAIPLAAIIDRDGDAHNDPYAVYLAVGISVLDLGHWLTDDSGKDSHHEIN